MAGISTDYFAVVSSAPSAPPGVPAGETAIRFNHANGHLYAWDPTGSGAWVDTTGSGGGGSGLPVVVTQTLAASAASISLTSLPGTYTSLLIHVLARVDTSGGGGPIKCQMNGDTGANYDWYSYDLFYASAAHAQGIGATAANVGAYSDTLAAAGTFSFSEILLPMYAGGTYKTFSGRGNWIQAQASGDINAMQFAGEWRSTAAITSLLLSTSAGNFVAGTKVVVYGLA